jgi:desulfoferrodoxin (superoxide reductase-like protein)
LATVGAFFAIGGLAKPALANVPTVAIDATKLEGNEFEVTVNIFHKGNNFFHYVDRVVLFADGEEVKVWKYSRRRRPESENFSVKTKVSVPQETVLSSVANCNLHGENKDKGRLILSPGSASK